MVQTPVLVDVELVEQVFDVQIPRPRGIRGLSVGGWVGGNKMENKTEKKRENKRKQKLDDMFWGKSFFFGENGAEIKRRNKKKNNKKQQDQQEQTKKCLP